MGQNRSRTSSLHCPAEVIASIAVVVFWTDHSIGQTDPGPGLQRSLMVSFGERLLGTRWRRSSGSTQREIAKGKLNSQNLTF